MEYEIDLIKKNKQIVFHDVIFPELFCVDFESMLAEKQLYSKCYKCKYACHCHVLIPLDDECNTYAKLCTVDFHRAVQPKLKLNDVN